MSPSCSSTLCSCGPHASGEVQTSGGACCSIPTLPHSWCPPPPPPHGLEPTSMELCCHPGCAQSLCILGSPSGSATAVLGRQVMATQPPRSSGGSVDKCPHAVTLGGEGIHDSPPPLQMHHSQHSRESAALLWWSGPSCVCGCGYSLASLILGTS